MPDTEDPNARTAEAMDRTAKAREASAYAAGAAKASWDALIKASEQAREAAEAWRVAKEAESTQIRTVQADDFEDPVVRAEATVISALARETRRRLEQQAHIAARRSAEAREIAEFTGNLALQAAREWGEAERAWLEICGELTGATQERQNIATADTEKIAITANGRSYSVDPGTTVAAFIESRGLPVESCIAELNGTALTRNELASTALAEGDRLEIVRAVAGGCENGSNRRRALSAARLYFICSAWKPVAELKKLVSEAIAGGVSIVQLRDHELSDQQILAAATMLRDVTSEAGALFVINDRADIALASGADGVHVGQDDLDPQVVRELVGPEMLIGLSTHSESEIDLAQTSGADYIGVGPVYETPTKPGRPGTGLNLVSYAARVSELPFFAIGGIDAKRTENVVEAGAKRIAVVRAIENAADPRSMAGKLHSILTGGKI